MKKASHWLRKSVVSSAIFAGNRALGFLARGRGGSTWVFFGWVCAARDSKLAPRSKKQFPLKLIPRSRNGSIFNTPF